MYKKQKNYLEEELTGQEKNYLKKIVMSTRHRYLEKLNFNELSLTEELEEYKEDIYSEALTDVGAFEKLFSDEKLYKLVKALSLKEKMVLFCLYHENKTIRETAEALNINKETVINRRDRALKEILRGIIEGGTSNV